MALCWVATWIFVMYIYHTIHTIRQGKELGCPMWEFGQCFTTMFIDGSSYHVGPPKNFPRGCKFRKKDLMCCRAHPHKYRKPTQHSVHCIKCYLRSCQHRRRINTEENAKVVAAVWGTEFIKFLAALAVLFKYSGEIHPILSIVLVQNSSDYICLFFHIYSSSMLTKLQYSTQYVGSGFLCNRHLSKIELMSAIYPPR